MQDIQNSAQSLFLSVAEYFTPVLTSSHFYEKGVLTPEEFVAAGDRLTSQCRTWQWAAGDKSMAKSYLPKDKQFLITRNVPSMRRAHTYSLAEAREELVEAGEGEGSGSEGWALTHADGGVGIGPAGSGSGSGSGSSAASPSEPLDLEAEDGSSTAAEAAAQHREEEEEEEGEVPDLESYIDDSLLEEADVGSLRITDSSGSSAAAGARPRVGGEGKVLRVEEPEDNIVKCRTYDLSIVYDKYYRTPRVFLFGYDEHRQPLTPDEIMQDISAEHAHKTVTVELHPHLGLPHASIHPCKHASVMKKIVDQLTEADRKSVV